MRGIVSVPCDGSKWENLFDLRFGRAGLSLSEAAQRCGVSVPTFRRWEKSNCAPAVVIEWLKLLAGDLGIIHPLWRECRLHDGQLYFAGERGLKLSHIAMYTNSLTLLNHLQFENQKLRQKIAQIRERSTECSFATSCSPRTLQFDNNLPISNTEHLGAGLVTTAPKSHG